MVRTGPTFWIVGAQKTGKSTLFKHLTRAASIFTIKVNIEIQDEVVESRFVDASLERMGTVPMYELDVALIVFDLTAEKALEEVATILEGIKKIASIKKTYLLANKIDLVLDRKVSENEVKSFADQHGLSYFEISAICNVGVDESFEVIKDESAQYIKSIPMLGYLSASKTASCFSSCTIM